MYLGHIGKYWYIYIKAYKNRDTCIDISIPLEVIFSRWWFSLVGSAILEKDFPKAKFFSRAPLCNCSSKPLSHSTQISSTLKQQLHSIKQNIPVCLWAWKYTGSWYVKNTKKTFPYIGSMCLWTWLKRRGNYKITSDNSSCLVYYLTGWILGCSTNSIVVKWFSHWVMIFLQNIWNTPTP